MATIYFQQTEERVSDQQEVRAFLESRDILYEAWDIAKLPASLQENYQLTDEDKEAILATFRDEIQDVSARRGYKTADVISLSDATPNLDELLVNFQKEHHHTDDEVRFIVSGHGIFAIDDAERGYFNIELNPGDLISVPVNTRHYFTLQEDRQVVAVRIFVTTEGWVPIYDKENVTA
ncbi:acireductone dioxygenase [Exiguobacterium profundum]|uniref:1,2-dihydroxy-3-keto-5-methylthiopentene dioxygenase n=1 Tax=Exiguobacterium TaxID=33986 RepID=UPI0018DA8F53|nr:MULTISPECIES: cupin domain-containing protein [Exiguobacterium]MCT4799092.1 cupin domain-containing protein [Exiguobacterium profundum]QPI68009.1 cupin domain-containing protein [Exiguobacterium sp. PBE]